MFEHRLIETHPAQPPSTPPDSSSYRPQSVLTLAVASAALALLAATPGAADAPFSAEQVIQTGLADVNNIAAGDLDGAGGADVFHGVEGAQTLAYVLQQPLDTWTPEALLPGNRMRDVALADLDGDGDLDLVHGDFDGGEVYWRQNDLDGSGAVLARVSIGSGIGGAQGLSIADIDGDSDLDVAVAGRSARTYFWLENTAGDASAWTRHTITDGVNAAQVVVAADLDGDGDLDIAGGSSSGSGKLAWYENVDGDGLSWVGRDIYSSRIAAVAAGDLDLDGDVDLLVQDILVDDILWLENTAGDGSAWAQDQIASFPAARSGLQAVDLDFDGDLDVVGDPDGNWWENIDKAASWTRRSYSDAPDVNDTAVVDLDGDGDRDIAVARNVAGQVSWFENLTCSPGDADADSDSVRDGCDVCPGFDDRLDADGDLTPDGCDVCPGFDDRVDNDGDGVPDACPSAGSITIDDVTLPEGGVGQTAFTFTVAFSGDVAGGFTVDWATEDQTAVAGDDYVSAAGTLSFTGTDGERQPITVQVLGDDRVEGQDAFRVVLAPPSSDAVDVDDGTGVGAIFNDDTATLSIDDPSSPEGDDGNAPLTLTVTVAGAVDGGFSVDFFSADGTATVADGDYLAAEGTLSFAGVDGEQQSIPVQVIGDTALEDDEAFSVRLLAPSHPAVLIADATGEPTILNDDEAVLTVGDLGQAEGNVGATAFAFPVTLTGADVAGGFTVSYSTADGTALAGSDYAAASGMLTFAGAIGETRTISVDVTGDGVLEGDETFAVELASPSVPAISVVGGVGTVLNDDSADITISDVSQPESDGGSTFRFAVTLDGEVEGGFTVPYATADGTATVADGDYASAAGVLTFAGADGESRDIDVAVTGDGTVEADETFTVDLGSASVAGITVGAGAVGTIVNDDSASVAIDDVVQLETDAATTFTFTVSLGGEVADGFTVPYATADGSATVDGGDYGAASGVLTFTGSDGEGQTVEVTVLGDEVVEADEGFTVELGAPSNAAVSASGASGAGTIVNDDDGAALVATLSVAVYEPPYDTVVYEMEITNVGTGDQRDDPDSDELENLLPDELSILAAVSDLPDFELTVDGPANALYGNGPLAAGERVRVTLEAAVDARAGAEISNQALVRFDTDGDGVNDSTGPSDDPSTPTVGDATALGVEAALPDIPTLDGVGLIAMGLLVILGGLRSARRGRKP